MSQTLLEMAKDLVLAQIQVHGLSPEDMRRALHHTYASLTDLQRQEDAHGSVAVAPSQPVNWRKSITKHWVTCLICGASAKQLTVRHLKTHGLDSRSYRQRFRIPPNQPLAARAVTAHRKQLAQQLRPWEKSPRYIKKQGKAQQPAVKMTRLRKAPETATPSVARPPQRASRKRTS